MCLYIQYNPFAISSGSRQYLSFPSTSEALASRRYDSCHMRQRSVDLVDINRKIRSKHHETGVEILGAQLIVQNSPDLRWALLNWKSLPLSGPTTLHTPKKPWMLQNADIHEACHISFHIQFMDRMKLWSHEIQASQRIPNDFPFLSAPFGGNHWVNGDGKLSQRHDLGHFWVNDGQWSVVIFHKPSNTRKRAVGEMSLCETICHQYVKLKRRGRSEERKKTNMSHPSTWRLLWWKKAALWWRRLQVSICFNQSSRTIFRRLKRLKRAHLKWEQNKHKHMHSHDQNDTKITSTIYVLIRSYVSIETLKPHETARNNLRCHHNKSLRWKTTCFHESWRPSRLCTTFSQLFLGGSDRLQSSKITETRSRLPIAEIRLTTRDVTIQKIAGLTTKCIGWCRISISNINSQKSRFWFWIVE